MTEKKNMCRPVMKEKDRLLWFACMAFNDYEECRFACLAGGDLVRCKYDSDACTCAAAVKDAASKLDLGGE